MGGFERIRDADSESGMKTLAEIHKEFDLTYGLTVMALEVFVVSRPGCVPNYDNDQISVRTQSHHLGSLFRSSQRGC